MKEPTYDVNVDAQAVQHFSYQVAGHGGLMKFGEGKICKPLIPIELCFYKGVFDYPSLLPFTATFFGTVNLTLTKDDVSGFIEQLDDLTTKTEFHEEADEHKEIMNPWSAKVAKHQFSSFYTTNTQQYLVLEDLTGKYKYPCICDVKMGTRQHGDDAAPDKKIRHQNKVLTTTSLPLGIRMCGIQAYQVKDKTYKYSSKYDGRKLTADTIKDALASYFDNSVVFRLEILKKFIARLREFYVVMQGVDDKFRFYSTSLLFVYEGDPEEPNPNIDMRMVDFAHTFTLEKEDINDDGYLFGLQNLINILEELAREKEQAAH